MNKEIKNRKRPRMTDYETPEGRNYLTYLYRDLHYTDQQAADEIGISRRTIYNWRAKSKIIDQAIHLGKAYTDTLVENALLQQALQGNFKAAEFWLRNRKPDQWNRDIRQQELNETTEIQDDGFIAALENKAGELWQDEPSEDD